MIVSFSLQSSRIRSIPVFLSHAFGKLSRLITETPSPFSRSHFPSFRDQSFGGGAQGGRGDHRIESP
jgi:hypothetical protein